MSDVARRSSSPEILDFTELISERDFISILISLYREYPELWQVKSKFYLDKHRRQLAMEKIVGVLKKFKKDFNEDKLKKKINILRTNFNKESRKIEELLRSGVSRDEVSEPTLWYFNDLHFIKDQGNGITKEDTENSKLTLETTVRPHTVPKKKKKWFPRKPPKECSEPLSTTESEADAVAKVWAMKLSRLPHDQKSFAEKIINDTLFEAEMGTLTRGGVCFMKPV